MSSIKLASGLALPLDVAGRMESWASKHGNKLAD